MTVQEYKALVNLTQLKKGDKNSQVGVVQGQLAAMGYYEGSINNSYDAATVSAMKLFQEANGISASGVADEITRSLLNAGTGKTYDEYVDELSVMEVSKGDTGLSVTLLQERLTELAYYDGTINGKYNAEVVTSVKRFQIANSVNASGAKYGVATTATRTAMNSASAINRYDAEGLLPRRPVLRRKGLDQRPTPAGLFERHHQQVHQRGDRGGKDIPNRQRAHRVGKRHPGNPQAAL